MPENENNEKIVSFEAPKSPRQSSAVVTGSEADAKALLTDAVYSSSTAALNRHLAYLEGYDEVVVAIPDSKKALEVASYLRVLSKHLPIAVVKKAAWKGAASVQDFIDTQNVYPSEVAEALSVDAEYIPDGGCYKPDFSKCIDWETQESILTGIKVLDRATGGLQYGKVSVLVACPGHGKSTFANQLTLSAVNQRIKTCVYSAELDEETLNTWIFTQAAAKKDIQMVKQKGSHKECPTVKDVQLKNRIQDALVEYTDYIDCDSDEPVSFQDMLRCFRTHMKQGYRFFIVDNLMSLTSGLPNEQEYAMQAGMTHRLVNFAKKYGCHVMIIAHPKKSDAEVKSMSDIYGSSKIANWVQEVWALHKLSLSDKKVYAEKNGKTFHPDSRIKNLKSRSRALFDEIFLTFDLANQRFNGEGDDIHFRWEDAPPMAQTTMSDEMLNIDESQPAF